MAIVRLPMQKEQLLNELMTCLPAHGVFDIMSKAHFVSDIKIKLILGNETEYNVVFLLRELRDFLCNNGYAIRRVDIKNQLDTDIIELTDRGRWLKEQGSFADYLNYREVKRNEKQKSDLEYINSIKRNKQMNILTLLIAISTAIAAIYYFGEILNHIFGFYSY